MYQWKGNTLGFYLKMTLSQIMLMIMLIISWIINEQGQILANFCKK